MLFTDVQSAVIPPLIEFLTPQSCPPCCIANHCIVLSLLLTCSSMEYMAHQSTKQEFKFGWPCAENIMYLVFSHFIAKMYSS